MPAAGIEAAAGECSGVSLLAVQLVRPVALYRAVARGGASSCCLPYLLSSRGIALRSLENTDHRGILMRRAMRSRHCGTEDLLNRRGPDGGQDGPATSAPVVARTTVAAQVSHARARGWRGRAHGPGDAHTAAATAPMCKHARHPASARRPTQFGSPNSGANPA